MPVMLSWPSTTEPESTRKETQSPALPTPDADPVPDGDLIEYDGHWLDRDDYLDLIRPRRIPEPCLYCGSRLTHTKTCDELRWRSELPFGKHKGKQFHQVPESYVRWLLEMNVRLPADLKQEIIDEFNYRRTETRAIPTTTPEFEKQLGIVFQRSHHTPPSST